MSDEVEYTDATPTEDTSSSDNSESSDQSQEAEPQEAAPTPSKEANIPFHEHPRFQELITQKNALQERLNDYEQKMQALQGQFQSQQAPAPKQNPFATVMERLQQIDPEFAGMQQKVLEAIQNVPNLQAQLAQYEMQTLRTQFENKFADLVKANNVSQEDATDYRERIENHIYKNPNTRINDLDGLFKQINDSTAKRREAYERKIRESYVTEKKRDKTPSTVTGGEAVPRSVKGPDLSTFEKRAAFLAKELRQSKKI